MTDDIRKDFLGQELAIGDVVTYSLARSGRGLLLGRIKKFSPKMVSVSRIVVSCSGGNHVRRSGKEGTDSVYAYETCKVDESYVTLLLLSMPTK